MVIIKKYLNELKIFGLKFNKQKSVYKNLGLNNRKSPKFLMLQQLKLFNLNIKKLKLNRLLLMEQKNIRNFLNTINLRRAIRYKRKLPCNGQRTRSNAKTLKHFNKKTPSKKKSKQRIKVSYASKK